MLRFVLIAKRLIKLGEAERIENYKNHVLLTKKYLEDNKEYSLITKEKGLINYNGGDGRNYLTPLGVESENYDLKRHEEAKKQLEEFKQDED